MNNQKNMKIVTIDDSSFERKIKGLLDKAAGVVEWSKRKLL